ncbi:MAG: hypothetical protein PF484_05265 [Bacteroidales bacterium]|jgi:hypothetical protein|nr:hypothetical protein [Bacteroidales bacterium]
MKTISKKQLWLIIICIAVAGFIFAEMYKSSHEIFNQRYTNTTTYSETIPLLIGNSYVISVYGSDEETGLQQWANLDFEFYVKDMDGVEVVRKNISATESQESGGIRRAVNGFEFDYLAEESIELTLYLNFIEGDDVDVKVFENISEWANLIPSLFIILFLVAIVFYLKARNAEK